MFAVREGDTVNELYHTSGAKKVNDCSKCVWLEQHGQPIPGPEKLIERSEPENDLVMILDTIPEKQLTNAVEYLNARRAIACALITIEQNTKWLRE